MLREERGGRAGGEGGGEEGIIFHFRDHHLNSRSPSLHRSVGRSSVHAPSFVRPTSRFLPGLSRCEKKDEFGEKREKNENEEEEEEV